jgi:hypothetical protein
MSIRIKLVLLAALLVNVLCNPTFAAITFLVQPDKATYAPGETAVMTVFAFDTAQTEDFFLEGFRIGFDLQPATGKGFDLAASSFSGSFGGLDGVFNAGAPSGFGTSVSSANFDFRATGERDPNDNGSANNLKNTTSSNAIKLLTISFAISPTATAGSYSFVFSPGATTSSGVYNRITSDGDFIFEGNEGFESFLASGGAFTISGEAIPEPTTITLLAIGLAGGVACRRFRKRSSSVGSGTTDPSTNEAKV